MVQHSMKIQVYIYMQESLQLCLAIKWDLDVKWYCNRFDLYKRKNKNIFILKNKKFCFIIIFFI